MLPLVISQELKAVVIKDLNLKPGKQYASKSQSITNWQRLPASCLQGVSVCVETETGSWWFASYRNKQFLIFFGCVSSVSLPPFKELIVGSNEDLNQFAGLSKNYRLVKVTMGRLTDCLWIQSVFFHLMYFKTKEFNCFTFFSLSGNTQHLQYGDNKFLHKLEVLLFSTMTIMECRVSILRVPTFPDRKEEC